jgi:hypothetical protein
MLLLSIFAMAQSANVTWGDEFKLRKGSTDLSVIFADASGVYVKESHMALKSYFIIGYSTREASTLIKLDKNLQEEYRNDFTKELRGKEFEQFFFLKGKLFILATDYSKKDKTLTLFAGEVNKQNGELANDWQEVTVWQKEEKNDGIDFNTTYNSDSSKMVLVSTLAGKEKNVYEVREFDEKMKMLGKPVVISNEFEPKLFQLEDVIYANNGNIAMVARIYDYQEGKKKKAKFREFQNYNIRIYDGKGTMVKEINTEISGKWLMSTKLLQVPGNDFVLAAYYSDQKKAKEINGMLVQRIDPQSGNVITTSLKEINTSMIDAVEDDNDDDGDDETRKERKAREKLEKIQNEEDGFSRYMRFRKFIFTADKGIVVLSEKYNTYTYTTVTQSGGFGPGSFASTRTTTYQVYETGDLMMNKIDAKGDITWLHVLPKNQREVIELGSSTGPASGFSMGINFFHNDFNMPFYSGFGVLANDKTISIGFNDHRKNDRVLQLGQKAKRISYFRKSDCYGLSLDPMTGKYTRSVLFSNDDVPTAMPRLGSNLGNELYIVGKEDRLLGKTKIAIAKVKLKG